MKRKLILIVTVVLTTLTTWSLRAGVNPHIVEVDLDIDYLAADDPTEWTPGGFVCVKGRKKITLQKVQPVEWGTTSGDSTKRVRLSWGSTKIAIYDAATGGNAVISGTDYANANLPTNFWVEGVAVSATAGTSTVPGPETILAQAIPDGMYDRISFTVYHVDSIAVTPNGLPSGATVSDPVPIGAGAMASDAHRATVEIQLSPPVSGLPLDISIVGGKGHDAGNEARLVIGKTTVVGGGPAATVLSGTSGLIVGELTSSDVLESCKIHTDLLERDVVFSWDDISEDGEWISSPDYLPDSGVVTHTLILRHHRDSSNWKPFTTHAVRMFVEEVQYLDANGVLQTLTYTANPNNQAQLDQWASCPTTDTIADADGRVSIAMTIHQSGLRSVTVAAYDWSVWQSSASATAWASASGGGITALAQAPTAPVREEKGNKKVKADNRGLPNCLLNQPEELPYGLVPIFVYVPVDPINAALLSVTITPLNNAPAGGLTKVANVFQQGQVPSEYNFGNGPCNVHNRAIAFQLEASKGGAYSVDVAYNGMLVKHGSFTCRVYEGKMTFDATVGPVVIPPTSRYVLPMNELGANNQLGALVATAILGQPLAMPLADYKARLFLMGGAAAIRIETSSGQQFISSVATPGSTLNAPATGVTGIKSVNLSATLEAEGSLKRNATYGRYRIKDAKRTINKVRCNMPCTQELSEVPGVAAPLTCDANLDTIEIVCPNVRIQSPTGDPTAAAGATGANADNEAVFDDQVPQGEVAGTCRIDAEGRVLSGLSAATSASIWSMLEWHIDNAGAIAAVCTPVQNAVHKQTIVYPGMPAVPTAFGPKKLRLRFRAAYNRPSWRCEQPMELFFARNGVSASSVQGVPAYVTAGSPNWLCYWTQIYPLTKGGGNPGITLAAGADSEHTLQFQTVTDPATGKLISQSLLGSSITIRAAHADSLSAFVGIFAHEQTHENDFFDVIWGGGGYAVAQDRDFDFLKDDWERTQPMLPPWSFDVPAYGNLLAMPGNNPAEDHSAWGESTVKYAAWSDVRADVAAKNAVNANLGIDASDWSDSTVASGVPHSFGDNDRPASETQTANPTTSGNHKGFHP